MTGLVDAPADGSSEAGGELEEAWPVAGIRLRVDDLELRPVTEGDLPLLARLMPADWEHDPTIDPWPGQDREAHRRRLLYQGLARSMASWSPSSWCLDFVVARHGEPVGVQSLEAERFPELRTVDSGSWLVPEVRGRGVGVAMRRAVLALAFDHLDARVAVSSARLDNHASLGVSRHLGYRDNGVSEVVSEHGVVELQHVRLTRTEWRAAGGGQAVGVAGVDRCGPWFGAI